MRDFAYDTPLPADWMTPLLSYAASENEVLRSAAIGTLAALPAGTQDVRETLLAALLDQDPDIRADAMEGLTHHGTQDDAETIRLSLAGDPVREVKVAAIAALARLQDKDAFGLLRRLVLSRAEDEVAWEDEGSDWEDWLDVQIAAIAALGQMGAVEAIEDMLAARDDELGQTLDGPVFEALSCLGQAGLSWLLAIVEVEHGLAARRAAEVLSRKAPGDLAAHLDMLVGSRDPRLRLVGVGCLDPGATELAGCVRTDPNADVRRAALLRAADAQPMLVLDALSDPAPEVQATALACLSPAEGADLQEDLIANMLAWLQGGPAVLMTQAARSLPDWAPEQAAAALLRLIDDRARPLEARLAATRSLAKVQPAVPCDALVALLGNPAQQVRTATLILLRDRAALGDETAQDLLAKLIAGTDPDAAPPSPAESADIETRRPDLDSVQPSLHITPNGEIVRSAPQDAGTAPPDGQSTLSEILARSHNLQSKDISSERGGNKARKRCSVEGPEDISLAISREAMAIAAMLAGQKIERSLMIWAADPGNPLYRSAWQALAQRKSRHALDAAAARLALRAVAGEDAVVRLAALQVLSGYPEGDAARKAAHRDPDPLIRAEAIGWLKPEDLPSAVADDALPVRRAAVARLLSSGSAAQIAHAVEALMRAERKDALCDLVAGSREAMSLVLEKLAATHLSGRQALVALAALGAAHARMRAEGASV
ncbi:HEAT repeat domain-containing protein [Thalassococcus sp. S3]|uniref:HEAT repeat domain-containing protein n=1 Tax=Thalassococcus sp. S3 TaxID=2017482 RepID=UPI0010247994|nr:HEAT repeat domain-containing protein [Thalassococcus sp. S3]QBF32514.1 hypothetical protein CFI11_15000 [Thalassococcus sp. S3]